MWNSEHNCWWAFLKMPFLIKDAIAALLALYLFMILYLGFSVPASGSTHSFEHFFHVCWQTVTSFHCFIWSPPSWSTAGCRPITLVWFIVFMCMLFACCAVKQQMYVGHSAVSASSVMISAGAINTDVYLQIVNTCLFPLLFNLFGLSFYISCSDINTCSPSRCFGNVQSICSFFSV